MDRDTYIDANRRAWNEAAPYHAAHRMQRLRCAFAEPGFSLLDQVDTEHLRELGAFQGKSVVQVCCNNGRELLSAKNLGAGRCVGIDFSEAFVAQAQEPNAIAGQDCEFVCASVYDLPHALNAQFDIALITIGVISWMPDVGEFYAVVAGLLKPGGSLFTHEQHPILDMIEPGAADAPVEWADSYFRTEPFTEDDSFDYYGGTEYVASRRYSWPYTMSQMISAGLAAGLSLAQFEERPEHISNTWWNVEAQGPQLPMSFTLTMKKPLSEPTL